MSWWLAVPAIASAASSLIGAGVSSSAARSEGQRAQAYASWNANNQTLWGQEQAAMISKAASINASTLMSQASANIGLNNQAIAYNVAQIQAANQYNTSLMEEEVDLLFDQLELNQHMLHVDSAKAIGSEVARQSASGTVIGEGSNAEVVSSMMAESALADAVLFANAQDKANVIQNSIAKSNWEAIQAINKVQFEGRLNNQASMINAQAQAQSIALDGAMGSFNAVRSAENRAKEIIYGGSQTKANQESQSRAYLANGLLSAGSSLLTAYADYKTAV